MTELKNSSSTRYKPAEGELTAAQGAERTLLEKHCRGFASDGRWTDGAPITEADFERLTKARARVKRARQRVGEARLG